MYVCSYDVCMYVCMCVCVYGWVVSHLGTAFIITVATGPVLGVLCAGYVVDQLGGYIGEKQTYKILKLNTFLVLIAAGCCLLVPLIITLITLIIH